MPRPPKLPNLRAGPGHGGWLQHAQCCSDPPKDRRNDPPIQSNGTDAFFVGTVSASVLKRCDTGTTFTHNSSARSFCRVRRFMSFEAFFGRRTLPVTVRLIGCRKVGQAQMAGFAKADLTAVFDINPS